MSAQAINKIDMGLDDIIKINRAEKRQQARASLRGARGSTRGQGNIKGAGGKGRGGAVSVKAVRGGLRGGTRGMGSRGNGNIQRGRGNISGQLNQRGGSAASLNKSRGGVLARGGARSQRGEARGRGGLQQARGRSGLQQARGRSGLQQTRGSFNNKRQKQQDPFTTQIFTNSGLEKLKKKKAIQLQNKKLNVAWKQAAFLREKQQAMKKLQQAKQNMRKALHTSQKSSRDSVVNQMRGFSVNSAQLPMTKNSGRGRRKLLASLMRPGNSNNNAFNVINQNNNTLRQNQAASLGIARQLNHTSVTITNPSALNPPPQTRRRRQWRKPRALATTDAFKIEVHNESPLPLQVPQAVSVLEKLKSLKPAVQTVYKFQKNVFAAPTTGVSLSDRFGSTSSSGNVGSGGGHLEDRKVFV